MGALLLVRHAQASFGLQDYDQLSNLGELQARLVADRLFNGSFAVRTIVSGTLRRQRATAETIGKACGMPVRVDARWDEYDHIGIVGDESAALVFDRQDPADGRARAESTLDQALHRWIAGNSNHLVPDVESHHDFTTRCLAGLRSMTLRRDTTVVTTSGGVIAVIASALLGLPPEAWPTLSKVTVNSGITKVVFGRSGTSLVSFNDHAHLEHDRTLITYR